MRFIVIRKNTILMLLTAIFAFVLCLVSLARSQEAQTVFWGTQKKEPYFCAVADNAVAITFDADLGEDNTLEILQILNEYGAKATFFATGYKAENNSDKLLAIKNNGNEIGTNSNTYAHMTRLSESRIKLEINTSIDAIRRAAQLESVDLFRCPYGEYSDRLLTVAQQTGVKTIQWNIDSLDNTDISPSQIAQNVLQSVDSGSIILMRTKEKNTANALRLVLEGLKLKGLECVTVSELISF